LTAFLSQVRRLRLTASRAILTPKFGWAALLARSAG